MRRGVERQQRGDAAAQRVGALEAGEAVRLFLRGALGVLRQPVGGIEEDRLGAHVGGGPFVLQQHQSQLEAALGVGVRRRPAVDDGERAQALGMTDRESSRRGRPARGRRMRLSVFVASRRRAISSAIAAML
jgi:hypothetical protein